MGHYTSLWIDVRLKSATPPAVISLLEALASQNDQRCLATLAQWRDAPGVKGAALFVENPHTWTALFCAFLGEHGGHTCDRYAHLQLPSGDSPARLQVHSALKNYAESKAQPIENFAAWLKPWIESGFVRSRYEEYESPIFTHSPPGVAPIHHPDSYQRGSAWDGAEDPPAQAQLHLFFGARVDAPAQACEIEVPGAFERQGRGE